MATEYFEVLRCPLPNRMHRQLPCPVSRLQHKGTSPHPSPAHSSSSLWNCGRMTAISFSIGFDLKKDLYMVRSPLDTYALGVTARFKHQHPARINDELGVAFRFGRFRVLQHLQSPIGRHREFSHQPQTADRLHLWLFAGAPFLVRQVGGPFIRSLHTSSIGEELSRLAPEHGFEEACSFSRFAPVILPDVLWRVPRGNSGDPARNILSERGRNPSGIIRLCSCTSTE